SGTVIAAMITEASSINNQVVPYEYGGGRQQIGQPDKGIAGGNHVGGYGTVRPECTLFDNPGVHIFMRLNGQIFGTSDGGGTPTSGGGSGGAWLTSGPEDR